MTHDEAAVRNSLEQLRQSAFEESEGGQATMAYAIVGSLVLLVDEVRKLRQFMEGMPEGPSSETSSERIARTGGHMAYVIDVEEPWIGPGYQTYYPEKTAEAHGVGVDAWLRELRKSTAEKGGKIVYEGALDERPKWLKDRFAAIEAAEAGDLASECD